MAKKRFERRKVVGVDMLAFSSIMTIMLAFFIMMTSFISDQEAELLQRATASFKKAVASFGLNSFFEKIGGQNVLDIEVESTKKKFPVKSVDNIYMKSNEDNNLLEENIEFDNIELQKETNVTDLIKFDPGDYNLNAKARRDLDDFAELVVGRPSRIMVEGMAGYGETEDKDKQEGWLLSIRRAHETAHYLSSKTGIDINRISTVGYGSHRSLRKQVNGVGQDSIVKLVILNE